MGCLLRRSVAEAGSGLGSAAVQVGEGCFDGWEVELEVVLFEAGGGAVAAVEGEFGVGAVER